MIKQQKYVLTDKKKPDLERSKIKVDTNSYDVGGKLSVYIRLNASTEGISERDVTMRQDALHHLPPNTNRWTLIEMAEVTMTISERLDL